MFQIQPNVILNMLSSEDTVRVLYVDNGIVVVISLVRKDSLPYELQYDELQCDIEEGRTVIQADCSVAFAFGFSEAQQRAIDRAWDVIGLFVTDIPDCYDSKIRSRFLTAKCKETGLTRTQIQRYLYRYWAGGMTKHALCPQYNKRGAPGKARQSTKRLGRPIQYPRNNPGLQIGPKERAFIKEAIEKHYTKHTKYSFRYAYQEMLKAHYTDKLLCQSL